MPDFDFDLVAPPFLDLAERVPRPPRLSDPTTGRPEYHGFHVRQHAIDASSALKFGVAGVTGADVTARSLVLLYEIMLNAAPRAEVQSNGEVYLARRSTGIGLVVKLSDI